MMTDRIKEELFFLQDIKYRDFQSRLIPTVRPETIIGVRTPELRRLAGRLAKEADMEEFFNQLPHTWFDENQLHAFLISGMKDYGQCMAETERFLPFVDNWATCDQMSPKVFRKNRPLLQEPIQKWMASEHTYTVRFAIGMLMEHFLDGDFDPAYLKLVSKIRSEEYYVNMMIAWYFATALAKQYEAALPFIEEKRLAPWTHNKAIQKSIESRRIAPEQKAYLKGLKLSVSKS